jgi:SAM-dependent methyltransferase
MTPKPVSKGYAVPRRLWPLLGAEYCFVRLFHRNRWPFWSEEAFRRQSEFLQRHHQTRDCFRHIEYGFAEWALNLQPGNDLLDVGTGETVFAGYLAQQVPCRLTALDHDRYCEEFLTGFYSDLRLPDFHLVFADATNSSLPDGAFDRILAVSVIEHFPDDGDTRFIREAARLLRPGGRLVITVPALNVYQENKEVVHYHGFERRYDVRALQERLIAPSGLIPRSLYYILRRENGLTARFLKKYHPDLNHLFGAWYRTENNLTLERYSHVLTHTFLDISDSPDGTEIGALLLLEKPASRKN